MDQCNGIMHLESAGKIHVVDECNDDENGVGVPISIMSNSIRDYILNKQLNTNTCLICSTF